jgi:N-acyl-L-homoserine lactone synthetase
MEFNMSINRTSVGVLPTSLALMNDGQIKVPEKIAKRAIQFIAKKIVVGDDKRGLSFSIVNSPSKWAQIRQLRLDVYNRKLPYMCDVLGDDGTDIFDSRSVVFGCWYRGQAIATIRFTTGPFEIADFIPENIADMAYPPEQRHKTLEFSRLIVDSNHDLSRVLPGLLIYTGLNISLFTDYDHYIGFTKSSVYNKLQRFMVSSLDAPFSIPSRGKHTYKILHGSFRKDYEHLVDQRVKSPFLANTVKKIYR